MSSQHQQIRFLASQFLPDEGESIAALDRNHRSALTQSRSLDEPGQRLLTLPLDWRAILQSGSRFSEETTRKTETQSGMMTQRTIIPLWARDLPSFFLWAERQGRGRKYSLGNVSCMREEGGGAPGEGTLPQTVLSLPKHP